MDTSKPRDFEQTLDPEHFHRAEAELSDEHLLVEQRVICPKGAGVILVILIIMAQGGMTFRGDVLIHIHLLAQRHHQHNAWRRNTHSRLGKDLWEIWLYCSMAKIISKNSTVTYGTYSRIIEQLISCSSLL